MNLDTTQPVPCITFYKIFSLPETSFPHVNNIDITRYCLSSFTLYISLIPYIFMQKTVAQFYLLYFTNEKTKR